MAGGSFRPVIGELDDSIKAGSVKRVLACSGKVYYDLVNARREREADNVAIIRVEQLYPSRTRRSKPNCASTRRPPK